MPITIDSACTNILSIEEFIEHVDNYVDLNSAESLSEAASEFRSVANDSGLIARYFNSVIKNFLNNAPLAAYTPQSIILGIGRGFFIRANIWTPLKLDANFRSQEEKVFSYRNTHDHNFLFMTVGYYGAGYETDLYQYDASKVKGCINETVELEFLGRSRLPVGRVMVYRKKIDVHTQFPPEELSVSLNLMVQESGEVQQDQYFFNPVNGRIIEMPQSALIHKRASIVALAGQLADSETANVISSLIEKAPCRRIREAALVAASKLKGITDKERFWLIEKGVDDQDLIVRDNARKLLQIQI